MTYFSPNDVAALSANRVGNANNDANLQQVADKMLQLHKALLSHIANNNIYIHPYSHPTHILGFESAATPLNAEMLTLSYFRPSTDASLVERLMGRESQESLHKGRASCHPVIEVRLTPRHFTVELILSPDAWWDQQNFVGKLSVKRHRHVFFKLLHGMDGDYRMGFWSGTHLSDMHLQTGQFAWARALDEWMGTFEEGRDWFRIGYWYDLDDPALDKGTIVTAVFQRIQTLYQIYDFLLWSSNNDYHDMYEQNTSRAAYA